MTSSPHLPPSKRPPLTVADALRNLAAAALERQRQRAPGVEPAAGDIVKK